LAIENFRIRKNVHFVFKQNPSPTIIATEMKIAIVCLLLVLGAGIANASESNPQLVKFTDFVSTSVVHLPSRPAKAGAKPPLSADDKKKILAQMKVILKGQKGVSKRAYRAAYKSLSKPQKFRVNFRYYQYKKLLRASKAKLPKRVGKAAKKSTPKKRSAKKSWRTYTPKEKADIKKKLKSIRARRARRRAALKACKKTPNTKACKLAAKLAAKRATKRAARRAARKAAKKARQGKKPAKKLPLKQRQAAWAKKSSKDRVKYGVRRSLRRSSKRTKVLKGRIAWTYLNPKQKAVLVSRYPVKAKKAKLL
jgi:hypothetical protein